MVFNYSVYVKEKSSVNLLCNSLGALKTSFHGYLTSDSGIPFWSNLPKSSNPNV